MLKNRVCSCLLVALLLAAMLPVSVAAAGALPSGTPAYEEYTFVGVSPLGTTINLFDYWLTGQTASDGKNPDNFENEGINYNHALLFGKGIGDMPENYGDWNQWTKGKAPRTGIVDSQLDENGYPVLDLTIKGTAIDGRDGRESLAYLFDPDRSHDGKAVYEDVQNLLQIDTDGYYSYNSQFNYAVFYEDTKSFLLYDHPGVRKGGATEHDGQFFPFNAVNSWNGSLYNSGMTSTHGSINHYFGVHMSTRFVQQNKGYIDDSQTKPVIYEFSGDDDVWVFIDGVLVADLGGIHDMASLSIDFATGKITINGNSQKQTLGEILGYRGNTLPDETYHTLDFFYLERGNVDSNMSLKYNLVYVPESNIYKIDQNGGPLLGSEFKLYEALPQDGKYVAGKVLAEGTTDAEGRIILLDDNGDLLTIQKLINKLNNPDLTNETTALILRETSSPNGYRSSGDLELYFYQPTSQTDSPPFLLSRNHWQTGAHAVARLTATTEENIEHTGGKDEFDPEDHLMFAVVFKKVEGQWRPISGSPATGWTVATNNSWESIREANLYRFVLSSSGSYTAMIDELPGDVKKYVEAVEVEEEGSYRIRYYFSKQNNLEAINGTNTYEITSPMNRVAAVNLYVPNIRNDLTVQKLDQNGDLITDGSAIFELRPALDGTYNPSVDDVKTRTEITSGGEATFTAIPNGTYYLVETAAPAGYTANATQVKVIVNDTGVYANAGTAEDGISVERGVGRLVNSMAQFASKNTVDTTLNQIVAKFYTTETEEPREGFQWRKIIEGSTDNDPAFSPVEGVVYHPAYSVTGNSLETAQWYPHETGPDGAMPVGMHLAHLADHSGDRCNGLYQTTVKLAASGGPGITAQETDTGWSALLVEQCKLHTRDSDTPHTDLTGKNLTDLTALFTGDVTVKVKNDRIVGNLAVQKTVAGNAGETGREWKFTIELKNANGTALSGNFHYEGGSIVTGVTPPTGGMLTLGNDGKATISLRHGQKITIKGIPVNATYTVTEDEADGYVTTSVSEKGTIQDNNTATAAFTNTKDVFQSLTVEKTVGGADGDKKKAWEFTIELKNANGTALSGDFDYKGESIEGVDQPPDDMLTFDSAGKATIRLKHGQKITIEGIPVNATYTVTETEAGKDGYVTTPGGTIIGTIKAGTDATASFTNSKTILRGGLTVTKTVAGNAGDTGREWEFTIELKNADGTALSGDFHYKKGGSIEGVDQPPDDTLKFDSAGKATIHLKHGQKITIEGIPVNATYTVTETEANQDGYTTNPAKGKHTGTIEANKTATAAFTNTKNVYGGLTVTKTVAGNAGETGREWHFTVTLDDNSISDDYGDMSFTGGVATFTLKHGEQKTATGLPAGISYTVTETEADQDGYTTNPAKGKHTGTIEANATDTAAFTNTKNVYGGLTVTKTVAGNAGDTGREWNFTVTLGDTGISGTYGGMRFTGGKATFTLKHGEQKAAKDLPAGISYTVTEAEANQDGYTTRATGASGRIPAEGTATAAFTNMKSIPRGNLSVSKTVSGSNPSSKTAFGFTVILSDRAVDGRFGEMTFRSGVAEFTLRHGETVTASGLPAGVGYLVQEEANEAYTVSSEGAEGLIEPDGTATARFVNRRVVLPPKTGDDSHTGLWLVLMALSLCCAALLAGLRKRGGRAGR